MACVLAAAQAEEPPQEPVGGKAAPAPPPQMPQASPAPHRAPPPRPPSSAYHKPLLLFAITEALARAAHVLMLLMGYRPTRQGRFSCWVAPPLEGGAAAGAGGGVLSPPTSPMGGPWASLGGGGGRRHSTSEAVAGAVHQAADAVHHAAEHALDATLTGVSAAAAVVAAQHPHGVAPPVAPRAGSPLALRPVAPPTPTLAAPAAAPRATELSGAANASGGALRRRHKADSASDYAGRAAPAEAATQAAVEAAEADAEVRLLSPFRLAAARPSSPAGGDDGGPADSAGSAAGGHRRGGTRPDVPVVFLHGVGFDKCLGGTAAGAGGARNERVHACSDTASLRGACSGSTCSAPAAPACCCCSPTARPPSLPMADTPRPRPLPRPPHPAARVLPYLHLVREMQQACGQTPFFMVEVRGVAERGRRPSPTPPALPAHPGHRHVAAAGSADRRDCMDLPAACRCPTWRCGCAGRRGRWMTWRMQVGGRGRAPRGVPPDVGGQYLRMDAPVQHSAAAFHCVRAGKLCGCIPAAAAAAAAAVLPHRSQRRARASFSKPRPAPPRPAPPHLQSRRFCGGTATAGAAWWATRTEPL